MVERKLVPIWEIEKYLNEGWIQLTPVYEGDALMERLTLIKGSANE